MYLTCAYETTTNATANSPWCDLLSLNDFKVQKTASISQNNKDNNNYGSVIIYYKNNKY